MKLSTKLAIVISFGVFGMSFARAAPVIVSGTVSGSSGDWTYQFTVTNNIGGSNDLYFFGVAIPDSSVGSPFADWSKWNNGSTWSNAGIGGSNIVYNDVWRGTYGILSGVSLTGFEVHSTDQTALSSVSWYGFASGGTYNGSDAFNYPGNPGFEGTAAVARAANVPEPAGWTMMIAGFGMVGATLRQRKWTATFH